MNQPTLQTPLSFSLAPSIDSFLFPALSPFLYPLQFPPSSLAMDINRPGFPPTANVTDFAPGLLRWNVNNIACLNPSKTTFPPSPLLPNHHPTSIKMSPPSQETEFDPHRPPTMELSSCCSEGLASSPFSGGSRRSFCGKAFLGFFRGFGFFAGVFSSDFFWLAVCVVSGLLVGRL